MKILALDLGKFKSVSCLLDTDTNAKEFWTHSRLNPKQVTAVGWRHAFFKAWEDKSKWLEKRRALSCEHDRAGGDCSRPRLAIPCEVARQQSLALFHQATSILQRIRLCRITGEEKCDRDP